MLKRASAGMPGMRVEGTTREKRGRQRIPNRRWEHKNTPRNIREKGKKTTVKYYKDQMKILAPGEKKKGRRPLSISYIITVKKSGKGGTGWIFNYFGAEPHKTLKPGKRKDLDNLRINEAEAEGLEVAPIGTVRDQNEKGRRGEKKGELKKLKGHRRRKSNWDELGTGM